MNYTEEEILAEEDEISIADFFRAFWRKKTLALILTLAIALTGTIGIYFGYNRVKSTYSCDFSYDIYQFDNYTEDKKDYINSIFPDGTIFRYADLISYERLSQVKESSEEFSSVDIDELYESDDISVSFDDEEGIYTIEAKAKYFKDESVAKNFISALASYPVEKVSSIMGSIAYDDNLTAYSQVNIYEDQLDYLSAQQKLLSEGFASLVDSFSEAYVVGGKSLNSYRKELEVFFVQNSLSVLYTELHTYGYVKDLQSAKRKYEAQIAEYEREKRYNALAIQSLKEELAELVADSYLGSTMYDSESFNVRIAALTERNIEIDKQLEILNGYLDDGEEKSVGAEAFEEKLDEIYLFLQETTDEYTAIVREIYGRNSTVDYESNSVISSNKTGIVVAAAISIAVGFVVAFIVNQFLCLPAVTEERREKEFERRKALRKRLREEE